MVRLMSKFLPFLMLLGCFIGLPPAQDVFAGTEDPEKVLEFVETVILGTEYGRNDPLCSKWVTSPKVSLFNGSEEDHIFVTKVTEELNRLLEPSPIKIKIAGPNSEKADIKIIFAPKSEFEQIAKNRGFYYIAGNEGYFYIRWTMRHEIINGIILINEKLKGKSRKHFLREELTQALGLSNDSSLFKQSIFYGSGADGGKATHFSELDRKLIRFFYEHIQPGYNSKKVREAFYKYWGASA